MIPAVVLAAGRSARMRSGHKLLQPFGAGTVLGMTVARVAASAVDEVIVVLGHDADRIRDAVAAGRARFVVATDFAEGMAASLRAGLAACPPETDAVLVCLGDMPLVRTATIAALLARFRDGADPRVVVAPVYAGARGHPVLWGRAHLPALAALRGDTGGRDLLAGDNFIRVTVDDPGILLDLDTDEALAAARLALGG